MTTEFHVYTGGDDPFETEFLGIRLVIHAGAPSDAKPPPPPVETPDILVPSGTSSPYRDLRVRDLDDDEALRALLGDVESGTDLRLHLRPSGADRLRLDGVIAGLKDSQATQVRVHVIPDDTDG